VRGASFNSSLQDYVLLARQCAHATKPHRNDLNAGVSEMQVSRLLRASVFLATATLAVPALAFGGHGGGGGGFHGGGGGFHGGGFGGGGFHGGGGGWHGGGGGWHGGGWRGGYGGWGYPGYGLGYGLGYGYPYGYDGGYPDDWGYGYGDPGSDYGYDNGYGSGPGVYAQPGYDQGSGGYSGPPPANGQLGQYCRTQVKVCQLYRASNVGAGCSCRIGGGSHAYGQVTP
jgi:hypothetical protein